MHYVYFIQMLPLLASGARHGHAHVHNRRRSVDGNGNPIEFVFMTEYITKTVTVEATTIKTNLATTPNMITVKESASATSVAPSSTTSNNPKNGIGHHPFSAIDVTPGSASIINSCDYAVYVSSVGHPSCQGPAANNIRIEPKTTFTEKLRNCDEGGVSLKVTKSQEPSKPMQFEYSIWKTDHGRVSYDISYLDCMKNDKGQQDLSACAGHDGGIQAVGGGNCQKYRCPAKKWCDKDAYVVAEFGYKPGAPVGACTIDKGIAFELCAEKH